MLGRGPRGARAQHEARRQKADPTYPPGGGATAIFAGSLALGARRVDLTERTREEALVRGDLPRRIEETGRSPNPFVEWDEAMDRLDRLRRAVAHESIGGLTRYPAFSRVLVVDHADRPLYGAVALRDADLAQVSLSRATRERWRALAV